MRVTNLALQVPEGSIYGFLGPNGAGKSTTLKMILGLVRPTQGEIQVFGQPMNRGNRIAVLRQVGSLIESPSYYGHLTGEENLRIVQTLRGLPPKAIREVLEIVRLEGQRGKKVCPLLPGDEAAAGHCHGPAGLSQAADFGRAHQRPGPCGHPGDAGADP